MGVRRWPAVAVICVAALNCFVSLGAPSLFGDEVFSVEIADGRAGDLLDHVRATEIAPPLYYALLKGWLWIAGSTAEAVVRLPSAIAVLLLVGAVMWLGWLVGGATVGLGAGLLTALSPLAVQYAQQARAYGITMLLVTVAVGAGIAAERRERHRSCWLAASASSSVLALWTHYTAGLVVGPLLVWIAAAAGFSRRQKAVTIAVCLAGAAVDLPLLIDQLGRGRAEHAEAGLTLDNSLRVLATPFDGRPVHGDAYRVLAAAVVVAAAALWAVLRRETVRRRLSPDALVAAAAVVPVAVVFGLALAGVDVLWTRYTAVAAPFIAVTLVAALAATRSRLAPAIFAGACALAALASWQSHERAGFYADTRGAVRAIAAGWRPHDLMLLPSSFAIDKSLRYYAQRLLPSDAELRPIDQPGSDLRARGLWFVTAPVSLATARANVRPIGQAPVFVRRFPGAPTVQVTGTRPRP